MGYGNFNTKVEDAFITGASKKYGNSQTDGRILLLFGNRIAEWREDGLYITNCGYTTNTTKNHLNVLPNVSICQRKRIWYLNGNEWNGSWVRVVEQVPPMQSCKTATVFDTTTKYIRTDGWRGYSQPVYAVCGANDTGMWEDSPARTDVCLMELERAAKALNGIPHKFVTSGTSNVFCIHRYLIVPPSYIEKARELFTVYYELAKDNTQLLYPVS